MRILIVNAYSHDDSGYQKFDLFQYSIMKFLAEQKESVDTGNEFFIRDSNSIEDFLYEIESQYVNKQCASKFDLVDIVFLAGEANIRPWAPSMKKVFSSQFNNNQDFDLYQNVHESQQDDVYGFIWDVGSSIFISYQFQENQEIQVINGKRGGNLAQIKNMKRDINSLKCNDYFLDNTSGDLYNFNYDTLEWMPKANTGLHNRQASQQFQTIGRFIVKAPIYKTKETIHQEGLIYKNKNNESICNIKKINYNHWAFIDIDSKFLVPLNNQWDVHNFSSPNLENQFVSLAETDEGPSVIEYQTFLACMFDIDPKYPHTLQVLRRFIIHTLKQIKSSRQPNIISISQKLTHQMLFDSIIQSRFIRILFEWVTEVTSLKCNYFTTNKKDVKKTLKLLQQRSKTLGISDATKDPEIIFMKIDQDNQALSTQNILRLSTPNILRRRLITSQISSRTNGVSQTPRVCSLTQENLTEDSQNKQTIPINVKRNNSIRLSSPNIQINRNKEFHLIKEEKGMPGPFVVPTIQSPVKIPIYFSQRYEDSKFTFRSIERGKWINKDFKL